jgi:uncharacterized protein (DUF2252 family)
MEEVSKRIKAFNKDRLQDMVQLKYNVMSQTLYRFYRGTDHLFYEDLAKAKPLPPSPLTWTCGDLHLENFGSYKSDNRLVYFDLDDFDEAILAPANYELARMVTSILIAFETLQIEQKKALNIAQLFLKSYSATLIKGKPNYIEPATANGIVKQFLDSVCKRKTKGLLQKKVLFKKKRLELLKSNSKHFTLKKDFKKELSAHITKWLKMDEQSPYNYKVIDSVFRLAGTGSVGQKRYIILLETLNETGEKFLLIDMKQSMPSSLKPYLKVKQPLFSSEAERIIAIQQRMQNRPPALLSATIFKDQPYVIQEMQPTEDSIDFNMIRKNYRDMCQVVNDMAVLTASAQLRSTGRQGSAIADDLIAFGQNDKWQEAIIKYAIEYSHCVKTDYMNYLTDYKKGAFKEKVKSNKAGLQKSPQA